MMPLCTFYYILYSNEFKGLNIDLHIFTAAAVAITPNPQEKAPPSPTHRAASRKGRLIELL